MWASVGGFRPFRQLRPYSGRKEWFFRNDISVVYLSSPDRLLSWLYQFQSQSGKTTWTSSSLQNISVNLSGKNQKSDDTISAPQLFILRAVFKTYCPVRFDMDCLLVSEQPIYVSYVYLDIEFSSRRDSHNIQIPSRSSFLSHTEALPMNRLSFPLSLALWVLSCGLSFAYWLENFRVYNFLEPRSKTFFQLKQSTHNDMNKTRISAR